MKLAKLPEVKPLESASVGSEDYKFENEKKSRGVELGRSELNRPLQPAHQCLRLEAVFSITHTNLKPNCRQSSCIVGNVGTRF